MSTGIPEREEAARLRKRFDGVNQALFARQFGVPGGASMVSQHINGRRPINMVAALAYAKGFGVALADISPRLAALANAAQKTNNNTKAPAAEQPAPPPPAPARNFEDRHDVSASDFAVLQAVKLVLPEAELARIAAEAARVRRVALEQIDAAKGERRAGLRSAGHTRRRVRRHQRSDQRRLARDVDRGRACELGSARGRWVTDRAAPQTLSSPRGA